jgi:Na+/proline symporter
MLGCMLAMIQNGLIFTLVLFAWSGLGAAFGPAILCALRWRKTTRQGVLAGMLLGFLTSVFWILLAKEHAYGLYEMVPAFFVGLVATIVVSLATFDPSVRSTNKEVSNE